MGWGKLVYSPTSLGAVGVEGSSQSCQKQDGKKIRRETEICDLAKEP